MNVSNISMQIDYQWRYFVHPECNLLHIMYDKGQITNEVEARS